jgi:hypothetical protein
MSFITANSRFNYIFNRDYCCLYWLGFCALNHSNRNTVFIIKPVTSKDTVLYKNHNYCSRGKDPELEEIAIKKSNRKLRKSGK